MQELSPLLMTFSSIAIFCFIILIMIAFSKRFRNFIIENRFFNWMQPVKTKTQDTKKPSTDESIDYLTRRINQLQSDLDKIKKDNWLNSNPRKFNYGDKVIFNGKECQVIEYKVHPSTIGFSWVYRLLEVGGTIVTHRKHAGYLTSDAQVGDEFQFESEISKVKKTKKTKK